MEKNLIDMHCDTISELVRNAPGETLAENHFCVDIKKMRQANVLVQFFACFVNVKEHTGKKRDLLNADQDEEPGNENYASEAWESAFREAMCFLNRLKEEESEELRLIRSFSEIEKNKKNHCISAVATVEEGGILNGKGERLQQIYEKGIRLMTLTWNYENCIGYPNSRKAEVMNRGLKPFGKKVIEEMNRLGMIVDVSHLSDGGFWDCIRLSKKPVVASHSNARALCAHPRNLTDEMLKALAEKGGVVGLNFYPLFLEKDGKAEIRSIARHAAHMIRVAGEEVVAVGTDFDGFEMPKQYLSGIGDIGQVWECMRQEGLTSRQVDKICSENALRVLKEILI